MKSNLKELMEGIINTTKVPDIEITGIAYDSREVKPGYIFAALTGTEQDGHDYIPQAIENGAEFILGSKPLSDLSIPYIQTPSTRSALAMIASRFYGEPTRDIPVIGITGTNGKTTCSYMIESILKTAGFSPIVLGTINYRHGDKIAPASITTPESVDLQHFVTRAKQEGGNAVVVEISSHGIAMDRVVGCHLDTAIFTNLSQDHLDYHKTMENYFHEKARLFTELLPASEKSKKCAIINGDDPYAHKLAKQIKLPMMRCGFDKDHEYRIAGEILNSDGIHAVIQTPDGSFSIESKLIGRFNLQNILLSIAACHSLGISFADMAGGIRKLVGIPGRLERVPNKKNLSIFVDYAHTPDALRNVIESILPFKEKKQSRLITVFGCGGDRDHEKRPLMGQAVAQTSDIILITSDNPRTEDPIAIVDQIIPGIHRENFPVYDSKSRRGYLILTDRRIAIRKAIEIATPNDFIIIAGKGHEDYQILGSKRVPFDDREEVHKVCEALI